MNGIPEYFKFEAKGNANPRAVIHFPGVRISLLTSRFVRAEFSRQEKFEDRPSQIIWFRDQPVPDFTVDKRDNLLEINTDHLCIRYKPDNPFAPFSSTNFTVVVKDLGEVWEYGLDDLKNLGADCFADLQIRPKSPFSELF